MKQILLVLLLGLPLPGFAATPPAAAKAPAAAAATIRVSEAWARALPPSVKTTAGYLVVENRGSTDDVLLGACIDGVEVAELHEMAHANGSMVMRHLESINVPAGGRVALAPGGLHLMLIGLQQPLRVGDRLTGLLHFRSAGDVPVTLEVRSP